MSNIFDPILSFRWTVVPDAGGFVYPMDSTKGPELLTYASGADAAPGPKRGKMAGVIILYSIVCAGANVDVTEQFLSGVAGTAADWITDPAVSCTYTVTAGAAAVLKTYAPNTTDWRIRATTAGAVTSLIVNGTVLRRAA